jgi:hypothetical protein
MSEAVPLAKTTALVVTVEIIQSISVSLLAIDAREMPTSELFMLICSHVAQ